LAVQAYRGQGAGALALAATTGPLDEPVSDGALTPMPYETPGQSFPGSAYYYIAHDAEPASDAAASVSLLQRGLHWDAQEPAAELALPNSGPAARALTGLTSTIDRSRALTCLTAAIYYEAASEPDDGQRAVAQVVLNRVAHPSYPNTVCGVVYQGSERDTGCQFTFTCDGALARKPSRYFWDRAEKVAREALAGYVITLLPCIPIGPTASISSARSAPIAFTALTAPPGRRGHSGWPMPGANPCHSRICTVPPPSLIWPMIRLRWPAPMRPRSAQPPRNIRMTSCATGAMRPIAPPICPAPTPSVRNIKTAGAGLDRLCDKA